MHESDSVETALTLKTKILKMEVVKTAAKFSALQNKPANIATKQKLNNSV